MSLLAEEVVEEWLNQQGYFTIRGIKLGVDEMDILAIKPLSNGKHDCRHIEVTASVNPIAYITKVPKHIQKKRGVGPDSAKKRDILELKQGLAEWVDKKFNKPKKVALRKRLCPEKWSKELVVHKVKHEEEIPLFEQEGVRVHRLEDIVSEMLASKKIVNAAAGNDLLNLMLLGRKDDEPSL